MNAGLRILLFVVLVAVIGNLGSMTWLVFLTVMGVLFFYGLGKASYRGWM